MHGDYRHILDIGLLLMQLTITQLLNYKQTYFITLDTELKYATQLNIPSQRRKYRIAEK